MTLARALQVAAGNSQESGDVAEAIDFDGTNDSLFTSTLTGAANGKTFTFSCFVWSPLTMPSAGYIYQNHDSSSGSRSSIFIEPSGNLRIYFYSPGFSDVVNFTASSAVAKNTFLNILISVDVSNVANRHVYINDVAVSGTWTSFVNTSMLLTGNSFFVGNNITNARYPGRLSNVFLDYTYRDLSVTANRRLFVTADLKPAAGQAALNPILYLPMNDPTAPGANAGTGGNFTLTGTVARSGRGPNQYNAPYSDLDGAADFLSRTTAPTGIADSKTFTAQFVFRSDNIATGNRDLIAFGQDAANPSFFVRLTSGAELDLQAYNAAGSVFALGAFTGSVFKTGRNYVLTISVDLSDTAKRHVYINGEAASVTWSTYLNLTIDFNIATTPKYNIAKGLGTVYYNGQLGAVWFNTSYIDLSVAANLAKFVTGTGIDAKPVDLGASGELPTGTAPIIYLPMYGNNAGKNYGTGGDFTVNSGPYTGARGPNEFWGNLADFNGTTGRLTKSTALTGVSDGKTISGSFSVMFDNASTNVRILSEATGSSNRLLITRTSGNALNIVVQDSVGTGVLNLSTPANVFAAATQYSVQFSFDLTNAAKRHIYINSVSQTLSVTTFSNANMYLTGDNWTIGALYTGTYSQYLDGKLSEFYLTTDYIDFSQEANRLKFRDAFGNPVNLTQQIEDAAIPNPAIYMRFPPTAFGTNSGTGGNFTVNGTITDGGQL